MLTARKEFCHEIAMCCRSLSLISNSTSGSKFRHSLLKIQFFCAASTWIWKLTTVRPTSRILCWQSERSSSKKFICVAGLWVYFLKAQTDCNSGTLSPSYDFFGQKYANMKRLLQVDQIREFTMLNRKRVLRWNSYTLHHSEFSF